jgi:DNA invertase Pin-like site-specific DNA recombinase
MRAAIYLRVSTAEQTTDNQERELRAAAARLGHDVVEVHRRALCDREDDPWQKRR